MKKNKLWWLIFISVVFLCSCSDSSSSATGVSEKGNYLFVLNSASSTMSKINTSSWETNNAFGNLGSSGGANSFASDGSYLYAINYTDQNLMKINPSSGEKTIFKSLSGYNSLYQIKIKNGYAYISVSGNNKLLKLNLSTKEISEYSVGTYPEGMCFDEEILYIACCGYSSSGYVNSSIYKFNTITNSIEKVIEEKTYKNAQDVKVVGNYLFAAFTGEYDVSSSYYYKNSCLKVYNKTNYDSVNIFTQESSGAPFTYLCTDGNNLYASSSGTKFFKLDLNNISSYAWQSSYASSSFSNINKIFYLNEYLIFLEPSYTANSSAHIFKNNSKVKSINCGMGSCDVLYLSNI